MVVKPAKAPRVSGVTSEYVEVDTAGGKVLVYKGGSVAGLSYLNCDLLAALASEVIFGFFGEETDRAVQMKPKKPKPKPKPGKPRPC